MIAWPCSNAGWQDLGVLSATMAAAMRAELLAELNQATEEAEAAADPLPETALLHVVEEG